MDLVIIIPAYNAKNTINKTLESIKKQILNINYEVVIINDCSDYDYYFYIKKYQKYFNIREIKSKENIGPGRARQLGIDKTDSKYIVFIDSDDYFYDKNSLKDMYQEMTSKNLDLLIANFIYQRDNKKLIKKRNFIWLHGKMYKREFLKENNIKFNNTRANEDNGFNRLILLLRPKIGYLDKTVYVYKDNPNSITRKNNRLYKFIGLKGFCFNMNWAMDEALKRKVDEKIICILAYNILGVLYYYYLDLEKEYDVSKLILWSKPIFKKYYILNKIYKIENINLQEIKENLKDDISVKKERISFQDFLKRY